MKFKFNKPEPEDEKTLWSCRMSNSDHERLEALMKRLKKNKTEVIRYIVRQAHAQLDSTIEHDDLRDQIAEIEKAAEQAGILKVKLQNIKTNLQAVEGV